MRGAGGLVGVGAVAAVMVASTAMQAAQAAAASADRRQDQAYAAATVDNWQRALDAEREKSRRLVAAVRNLQAENDALDDALACASMENEALRQEVADLQRKTLRRVS